METKQNHRHVIQQSHRARKLESGRDKQRAESKANARRWNQTLARLKRTIPKNPAPTDRCIHDLRVAIKHLLAFLELVRGALSKEDYRLLRLQLKSHAAVLALYREPVILEGSFNCLLKWVSKKKGAKFAVAFDRVFHPPKQTPMRIVANSHKAINRLLIRFAPPAESVEEVFKRGNCHTYKKTREAWRRASKSKKASDLHRWRKWAKFLYLQLQLLAQDQTTLSGFGKKLKRLQKRLGDHHDFVNLQKFINREWRGRDRQLGKCADKLIRSRLRSLESKVFKEGERLFHDRRP